jgi:hypothetical protein
VRDEAFDVGVAPSVVACIHPENPRWRTFVESSLAAGS